MINILSWNVNGIKSVFERGYLDEILTGYYDIVCLQEVKTNDLKFIHRIVPSEYNIYANFSIYKGRNGVVILSKMPAVAIDYLIGHDEFDKQGRYIKVDFSNFSVINLYMPHGGRDKVNLNYKLEVVDVILSKLRNENNKDIVICTDFNIARSDIDVCRATQNYQNIMFTAEERKAVSRLCDIGYKDVFRALNPERIEYTWWSYAFNCRTRNIGWRIDYFFASERMMERTVLVEILKEQMGSDHCPIIMQIKGD